jgi:glutaredoxin
VTVTLYGKAGCHLCLEARAVVSALQEELRFALEEVDVSLDPRLHNVYGERIPVVAIDGEDALELVISEQDLRAALARAEEGPPVQ